jgi:iron(III) transport system permease protein
MPAMTRTARALALLILLGPVAALSASVIAALLGQGLAPFRSALPDARTLVLLLRSTALAAVVAVSCTVAGALAATFLARRTRLSSSVRLLFPALVVVPPYLQAVIWTTCLFSLNSWLDAHGLQSARLDGWAGTWWAEFMGLLPLATGLALVSLESVDPALVDAASTSRAPSAVLLKITIPLAAPYLAAGAGILFLISFLDYSVPSLFTVNVYALEIFSRYSADGQAVTAALVSIPVVVVAWLVIRCVLSPLRHAASTPHRRSATAAVSGPWPWWLAAARWLSLGLLAGQAIVPVVWLSLMCGSVHSVILAATSAGHEILVTCEIALACACLAVVLGPVVAARLAARGRVATFWWIAVCVAFAAPGPLVGVGLAWIGTRFPALREGLWMPVWANASRFLPVAAFIVFAHLRRVDPLLLDAARIYRRNWLHSLLHVRLPLAMPALLVAGAVCIVLPMGELGATIIVAPPGGSTLMMRLYNLLHYGESREVAALCVVLMLMALFAAVITVAIVRRIGRRTWAGSGDDSTS